MAGTIIWAGESGARLDGARLAGAKPLDGARLAGVKPLGGAR